MSSDDDWETDPDAINTQTEQVPFAREHATTDRPTQLEDPHWLTLDLWFDPEQQQRFGKAKGISGTVRMSEVKEAVLQAEQEKVRPSLSFARSKSSPRAPRSAR
jgi:hypothetical protein